MLTDAGILHYAQAIGLWVSALQSNVKFYTNPLQFIRMSRFSSWFVYFTLGGMGISQTFHLEGNPQSANLGDGNGWVNQTVCPPPLVLIMCQKLTKPRSHIQMELRADFADYELGTCLESLVGGNHFRRVQSFRCNYSSR